MRKEIWMWSLILTCVAPSRRSAVMCFHRPGRRQSFRLRELSLPGHFLVMAIALSAPARWRLAARQIRGVDMWRTVSSDVLSQSGTARYRLRRATARGGMIDLGTLGGTFSAATSVNAEGQVAGHAETASGETHAFRWDPVNRSMRDLGTLGGKSSYAQGINDRGDVVGYSENAGRSAGLCLAQC